MRETLDDGFKYAAKPRYKPLCGLLIIIAVRRYLYFSLFSLISYLRRKHASM